METGKVESGKAIGLNKWNVERGKWQSEGYTSVQLKLMPLSGLQPPTTVNAQIFRNTLPS